MTAREQSPLRKALAAKQVLTTHYDIPQVPRPTIDAIIERLNEARQAAYRAHSPGATGTKAQREKTAREADAKVAEVKAEFDACFYRVEFRALKDDADMDALVNAYPATEAQKAKDPEAEIDMDAFNVAYLVACVQNSDLTEDEWRAELWSDRWTAADRWNSMGLGIFNKVHEANQRGFNDGINFE